MLQCTRSELKRGLEFTIHETVNQIGTVAAGGVEMNEFAKWANLVTPFECDSIDSERIVEGHRRGSCQIARRLTRKIPCILWGKVLASRTTASEMLLFREELS